MGTYVNIKVSNQVADRFRGLSPGLAKSHSDALNLLMDVHLRWSTKRNIETNSHVKSIQVHGDKNTDRLVSILKAIEHDKIDRILSMLIVLFDHGAKRRNPDKPGLKNVNSTPTKDVEQTSNAMVIVQLEEEKLKLGDQIFFMKKEIGGLLHKKAKLVRPPLGKSYVRLDMDLEEFEKLKERFKPD